MRNIVFAVTLTALVLPRPTMATEKLDVIRPEDSKMSCASMATEINDLTRKTAKQRERAAKKASGRTGMRGLFGVLSPMAIPVLTEVSAQHGGVIGSTAESAGYAIQNGAAAPTSDAKPIQGAAPSLEQQRLDRLNKLHTSKAC